MAAANPIEVLERAGMNFTGMLHLCYLLVHFHMLFPYLSFQNGLNHLSTPSGFTRF